MALQRKILGPAAAIERRPPIAIKIPSGARVTAPPASLLRQRVGNKASQALLSRGPSPSGSAVGESRVAAGAPAPAPAARTGESAAPAQKKAGAGQPESKAPPESQAASDMSAAPAAAKKLRKRAAGSGFPEGDRSDEESQSGPEKIPTT